MSLSKARHERNRANIEARASNGVQKGPGGIKAEGGARRINGLESVQEVLAVHDTYGGALLPLSMSACWSRTAKLTRQSHTERAWLTEHVDQLQPLLHTTLKHLPDFRFSELCTVAHGVAITGKTVGFEPGKVLWPAISGAVVQQMGEHRPRDLSTLVWAFATAGQADPVVFDAVAEVATPHLGEFNHQQIANILWAFASVDHASPAMFLAAADSAASRLDSFSAQSLANTAWAFTTANVPAPALFANARFGERCDQATLLQKELSQMHQFSLWLDELGEQWPPLPPALLERCRASVGVTPGGAAPVSQLQAQVVDALRKLGLQTTVEVLTPQGYTIDAVVHAGGREVGVEVDGPSHFMGAANTPTGKTRLKRRQLRAFGWSLVDVPYWEWNALQDDAAKAKYLVRKMTECDGDVERSC